MSIQKYKFIRTNEEIWKKELRLILNRDIHEKGLGCCIADTHMKIGNIHIEKFFEAQFLFGNSYWTSIFSNALMSQFDNYNFCKEKKVLIVGYETYIEPVLLKTTDLLILKGYNVDYCIYEEPRYILNHQKSEIRLRLSNCNELAEYDHFFIVCGISSTLNTYRQIIEKIEKEKKIDHYNTIKNTRFCSIIQVLPKEFQGKIKGTYEFSELLNNPEQLSYDSENQCVHRTFNFGACKNITANYLINIFCEWQNAENCQWCFDESQERPLVTTNETSVIPVQMIGHQNVKNKMLKVRNTNKKSYFDFFEQNNNGDFVYSDFLYYNHIERDNHHFQYYIRSNALLKYLTTDKEKNKKLIEFCNSIKSGLFENTECNRIDIIVVPIHYSNEHFFNIINQKVFDGHAEIINFDPQREYRSNFETKYSNYSYVLDSINTQNNTKIYFHYIDDQIISGNTFYRAKSFVRSLFENYNNDCSIQENIYVFESIITLINRNSSSTKFNYINNISNYYSLFDIAVPSLRNHGDSCYLCSKSFNAQTIKTKSAMLNMSKYWEEREEYHCVKTLGQAKSIKFKQSSEINNRKFRQFYCENLIWKKLKNNWSKADEIYIELINIIASEVKKKKGEMKYEYIISFVKVMSKPFIYYREEIKKAVYFLLKYMIYILNHNPDIAAQSMLKALKMVKVGAHNITILNIDNFLLNLKNGQKSKRFYNEKYYLYVILLARLCYINSNYLIKHNNIIKALEFYKYIVQNSKKPNDTLLPIEEFIKPYIKIVTNGISGNCKAKILDQEIKSNKTDNEYVNIIKKIYLENLEAEDEKPEKLIDISSENESIREKYIKNLKIISKNKESCLFIDFSSNEELFILAKNKDESNMFDKNSKSYMENIKANIDEDVIITEDYAIIKCYELDKPITNAIKIYLVIHCKKNKLDIDFDQLKYIRTVLMYRYELYSILEKDLETGALNELYQDDKWVEMLSHPKTVSHGQSEDIKEHLNNLEEKFNLYNLIGNDEKKCNIYGDLTLFANLVISFLYSKMLAMERGDVYKFDEELKLTRINSIQSPPKSQNNSQGSNHTLDFEEKSLLMENIDIAQLFMQRFEYYINCMKNKANIKVLDNDLKDIGDYISLQCTNENSIWFPIVFIHILVKNAMKHGEKNGEIIIQFIKNGLFFDLVVKNKIDNSEKRALGGGITKKAFDFAFKDENSRISFCDNKQGEYEVKITSFFYGGKI